MSKKRVLMIDNDRFTLSVLHRLVSGMGHEPMIGTTAEAAETLLKSRPPDVIIYNRDLDAEWGYSIIDQLRRCGDAPPIPVILLTQTSGRYGPRITEHGDVTVCFQKPIAIEPFVALFLTLTDSRPVLERPSRHDGISCC